MEDHSEVVKSLKERLAESNKRCEKLLRMLAWNCGTNGVKMEELVPDEAARREHQVGGPRKPKDGRRDSWRSLEADSAEETGGEDRPRPNKGDGTAFGKRFVRECKNTETDKLAVRRGWLRKLRKEAERASALPMFVMGFSADFHGVEERWVCIPMDMLEKAVPAMVEEMR